MVSLYQVEQLQFDDTAASLTTTPASGEFQVNTYTTSNQSGSSTAALNDGSFVVTWTSDLQDGDYYGIYAQRYDLDGDVNGAEFQVNTYTTSNQWKSSTAALSDGGFVVTWTSDLQDGDYYGIYAQRYDANGDVNGAEFQVNTYTTSEQYGSSTAALSDGGFVVTWHSDLQDGDGYGIYAQRYDVDGDVNGAEFQVNTYTTSTQTSSSTAALNDGGFVVTWTSVGQDGDNSGIYAQRYDVNGDVNGAEFQVNTYTTSYQNNSSTAALNDGGFVVTWESYHQDGDYYGIYAQRYDANGDALGEVTINSTPVVASVIADASTTEDSAYSYDASSSFSDADGDTLSYTAKLSNGNALPSWLSISSTGTLSGTPANADVGALAVIVTAADSDALMASDTFTLTVRNVATVIDADGNLWDSTIAVGDGSFIGAEEAQLYRSYFGAMGRLPDEGGYNWWLGEIQAGRHTLESMAAGFVDSSEFKSLADTDSSGVISNQEFILHMYNGVFGRDPDAEGLAWWVGQLDTQAKTQPDAFISMTQSNEYVELTVETVADMMFL